MFAGLIVGSVLGLLYKRLAYGPLKASAGIGSHPGDDALIVVAVTCAVIGIAFDIRRGLAK
jgi:hypothetical protein